MADDGRMVYEAGTELPDDPLGEPALWEALRSGASV
jgi:hypothetical protein